MTTHTAVSVGTGQNGDLISDCRIMLRFARKTGADLSPQLEQQIARLDALLDESSQRTISDIPPAVATKRIGPTVPVIPGAEQPAAPAPMPESGTELILEVHGALSRVIAPATAMSLQSSEPAPGRHRFFGGMPLVVKAAALAAIICAIGFVVSAGVVAYNAGQKTNATSTPAAGDSQKASKP